MNDNLEISEHALFDRRQLLRARLPATTRKKFLSSYRTAYTTLITIVLTYYWEFGSSSATYVAPLLSAISGVDSYFGQWQNDFWKIIYSAAFGSAIGVAIGYAWFFYYIQIILMFIALTWVNRISLWDRLGKIIAAIGILLGTAWPTLTDGAIIGLDSFRYGILIFTIPWAITGVCLLFPKLTLATFAAEEKVSKICVTLNSAVSALVRGFCAADYADLYTAEVDHLIALLTKDLDELAVLKSFVESEALVFHKLQLFGPALGKFIDTVRLIVYEISSVRDNLDALLHNKTQAKFVEVLRPILGNLGADIEILLFVVDENLTSSYTIYIYPVFVYSMWTSLNRKVEVFLDCFLDGRYPDRSTSLSSVETAGNSQLTIALPKLDLNDDNDQINRRYFDSHSRSLKIKSMHDRRVFFMHYSDRNISPKEESEEFLYTDFSRKESDVEGSGSGSGFERASEKSVEKGKALRGTGKIRSDNGAGFVRRNELRQTIQRLRASQSEMIALYGRARAQYVLPTVPHKASTLKDEAAAAAVLAETKLLSMKNLGPRAALLHRTSLLTELICSLDSVLNIEIDSSTAKVTYISSFLSFGKRAVLTIYTYVKDVGTSCAGNIAYIFSILIPTLFIVASKKSVALFSSDTEISSQSDPTPPFSSSSSSSPAFFSSSNAPSPSPSTTNTEIPQGSISSSSYEDPTLISIYGAKSFKNHNHLHGKGAALCGVVPLTSPHETSVHPQSTSPPFYLLSDLELEVLQVLRAKSSELLGIYAQSMKISLGVTITSFFLLVPALKETYQNSLWAILVVILIRQENTSSSFLTGYQRLEGTVIGAVYAFTMFQIFTCATNECGMNITTPVLVIWLAVCAFFRDGPRHGYAAIVAGFTPIVLFLGNTPSTAAGAWMRVEETWIGVGIYLLIDNLILPNRTDVALRAGVLLSIRETKTVMGESLAAVRALVTIGIDLAAATEQHRDTDYNSSFNRLKSDHKISIGKSENIQVSREEMEDGGEGGSSLNDDQEELKNDTENSAYVNSMKDGLSSLSRSNIGNLSDRDINAPTYQAKFDKCAYHLAACAAGVSRLKDLIAKDAMNLSLVVHEPEIWRRSFPAEVYKPLLTCFSNVMKSTRSVATAIQAFSGLLQGMLRRGEADQVALHLSTLAFMVDHLLAVSDKTDLALHLATDSNGIRKPSELLTDLTAIVTLSRGCEAMLQAVDHHYLTDVFHSVSAATKNLSQLGIALRAVRDDEALSAL